MSIVGIGLFIGSIVGYALFHFLRWRYNISVPDSLMFGLGVLLLSVAFSLCVVDDVDTGWGTDETSCCCDCCKNHEEVKEQER